MKFIRFVKQTKTKSILEWNKNKENQTSKRRWKQAPRIEGTQECYWSKLSVSHFVNDRSLLVAGCGLGVAYTVDRALRIVSTTFYGALHILFTISNSIFYVVADSSSYCIFSSCLGISIAYLILSHFGNLIELFPIVRTCSNAAIRLDR